MLRNICVGAGRRVHCQNSIYPGQVVVPVITTDNRIINTGDLFETRSKRIRYAGLRVVNIEHELF